MAENLTLSYCVCLLVDLGFSLCDGWVLVCVVCGDLCSSLCHVWVSIYAVYGCWFVQWVDFSFSGMCSGGGCG